MEYQQGIISVSAAVLGSRGVPRMVLQCTSTREALAPREYAIGEALRAAAEALAATA